MGATLVTKIYWLKQTTVQAPVLYFLFAVDVDSF